MIFLDIDHFKAVNDAYGHQEGDRILQSAAQNMTAHLRSTDVCGRWGGEEFIAILYNVTQDSLLRIAEKLRAMIANSSIRVNGGSVSVTVSIGAALVREGDTLDSIVERADRLMYRSKREGRNRVSVEA